MDTSGYRLLVNPTGRFEIGGPMGDAGLTGRKIIVDTYGGYARHGGGAFSGKDPSKVDRSAAYAMRWVAKNVVAAGLAERCEVQVAYAIGKAQPVGLFVETFGTEAVPVDRIEEAVTEVFDLRPAAIIRDLDLLRPIYQQTAAYGHFGRELPDFTWERTDRAAELKSARPRLSLSDHWLRAGRRRWAGPFRRCRTALVDHGSWRAAAGPGPLAGRPAGGAASRPRPTRSRGSPSTCRWPIWTGRSTTWCRRSWTAAVAPARGCGSGSPGSWSTAVVLERVAASEHGGRLAFLEQGGLGRAGARAAVAALARAVADRYAGSLTDVLRLAVPAPPRRRPRPSRRRSRPGRRSTAGPPAAGAAYRGRARRSSRALADGRAPRAVWSALPGEDWPARLAEAVAATVRRRPGRAAGRRRTPATWTGWTPPSAPRSVRAGTSRWPPTSVRPSGTGGSCGRAAATCGWWPGPGRRRSRRSPTWAWSRSGTTATTCTPSRGRRTRTPATCC